MKIKISLLPQNPASLLGFFPKMTTTLGIICGVLFSIHINAADTQINGNSELSLSTTVSGNQEQPKILYIVPWQPSSSREQLTIPIDSQLSNVFEHIERSELERELYLLLDAKQ